MTGISLYTNRHQPWKVIFRELAMDLTHGSLVRDAFAIAKAAPGIFSAVSAGMVGGPVIMRESTHVLYSGSAARTNVVIVRHHDPGGLDEGFLTMSTVTYTRVVESFSGTTTTVRTDEYQKTEGQAMAAALGKMFSGVAGALPICSFLIGAISRSRQKIRMANFSRTSAILFPRESRSLRRRAVTDSISPLLSQHLSRRLLSCILSSAGKKGRSLLWRAASTC